jgi:2-polyprenyl-6-methoxyphenol hydroxylase-like FAD-dependent oxidoreductase
MITVIGAGLGGLTLAAVLHANDVEVEVYDGDVSPDARHQGGMLDMHVESGQAALRDAGLFEGFQRLTLEGGDAMRILDKQGVVRMADGSNGERPEIDRGALRDLLLSALPDGLIHWGKRVTAVDGKTVTFADGSTLTAEVLVGADGAWSKVRPVLTPAVPAYTGISFVEIRIEHADERHPRLADVVGPGLLFALGDEKGFIAHREGDGELCVYVALKTPVDWVTSGDITRESLVAHFAGWDETLRALITESDGTFIPRPLHALPVGLRWERVPGVTLIGDAAHLMSPFAGEGANLAMQDGAELARALIDNRYDVEKGLVAYETAMFPRSAAAAFESDFNLVECFQPGGPQPLIDQFNRYAEAGAQQ